LKRPLLALFVLLATVAAISFVAGLTLGARRWEAKAIYADDREQLRRDTARHLDTCIEEMAKARSQCEPAMAPVDWARR